MEHIELHHKEHIQQSLDFFFAKEVAALVQAHTAPAPTGSIVNAAAGHRTPADIIIRQNTQGLQRIVSTDRRSGSDVHLLRGHIQGICFLLQRRVAGDNDPCLPGGGAYQRNTQFALHLLAILQGEGAVQRLICAGIGNQMHTHSPFLKFRPGTARRIG